MTFTLTNQKSSGVPRSELQMELFRYVLEDCELGDLGYKGSKYTWSNCREAGQFIKERLNRATANQAWCSMFSEVDVSVLAARSSNHKPLLVTFSSSRATRRYYNPKH